MAPPTIRFLSSPPFSPASARPSKEFSIKSTDKSNADLLADVARGGDVARPAWSDLVSKYSLKMYAVARSFAFDEATAEDLVQIAWLRLLERVAQVREPESLGQWLCMVVRNEARNRVTRRREIPAVLDFDLLVDNEPMEAGLIRDERITALRLAFARLGEECQQLLRLLLAEPALTYDEVAAALGRARGSLGPARRRCLDQLRAHLPEGFEL
jgi:RNA polymerase sigma factor (sigma-70 family)